ncbi:hypothetical protein HYPSUDRAFT_35882 [Hypholoma sublateritium FD-334 SS-4]|uniref:Uncharacterized protein n=1 Tax=Hypholoma sublateritium (strain FD-334 SS-4) TaxID=945553 RepID=A0A0D2MRY7_HYPSF|nr:hypothetical protein HYPSUDRAFT_35882 [Hypholoma sublateritium FD-334 SS-4]
MMRIAVTLSNTSDQIIRVEIPTANFDEYIMSAELKTVQLEINTIFNIKLTQGRNVQRTNFTPTQEGQTVNLSRYFQ